MRHKSVTLVIIITLFSMTIFACSKGKEVKVATEKTAAGRKFAAQPAPVAPPAVQQPEAAPPKPELPKYVYKSSGRRDPFIPLVGKVEVRPVTTTETTPASSSEVNIASLTVQGLIWDKAKPYVLLKAPDGATYIVTEKRLVDDRGRVIKGVAAVIKEDKVVLIGKNNVIKEFKFSNIREESD